jgi:hypothetical protein
MIEFRQIEPIVPELDFIIERAPNDRYMKTRKDGRHGLTIGDEARIYQALVRVKVELDLADKHIAKLKEMLTTKGKKAANQH